MTSFLRVHFNHHIRKKIQNTFCLERVLHECWWLARALASCWVKKTWKPFDVKAGLFHSHKLVSYSPPHVKIPVLLWIYSHELVSYSPPHVNDTRAALNILGWCPKEVVNVNYFYVVLLLSSIRQCCSYNLRFPWKHIQQK